MDLQQCHNPLFAREKVQDLDGEWLFSFDNVVWQTIRVPFCPQSDLSGIGRKDFFDCCYYKRSFTVKRDGDLAILHFGAVDYHEAQNRNHSAAAFVAILLPKHRHNAKTNRAYYQKNVCHFISSYLFFLLRVRRFSF